MSVEFFLDTNILVYSFDLKAKKKRSIALGLVSEALHGKGAISYQVIQEFLNVATRKFTTPLNPGEATEYLQKVLKPLSQLQPSILLFSTALSIQAMHGFSFYDSLIIAAAVHLSCQRLFSEDLPHGQVVRGVRIENPFI